MSQASRNLVLLCDGTNNEVKQDLTNVLKLYRMATRGENQVVFYDPGVGTIGLVNDWGKLRQGWNTFIGLTTGWGLDQNILDAYTFLCTNYRDGDRIFLFGFSRGAYTTRAVAGLIFMIGLLRPEQLNLAGNALTAYKRASSENDLGIPERSRDVVTSRRATVHFLGVWDSVASVIIPRRNRFYLPGMAFLPFTKNNPGVRTFRQAAAIDERRSMFQLYRWGKGQKFQPDLKAPPLGEQDQQTVWFAGNHSDVGGGYPEAESHAAKFALIWMTREAQKHGLRIDRHLFEHLALGKQSPGDKMDYAAPDAHAPVHDSMKGIWPLFELVPKNRKWKRWPKASRSWGYYLPLSEPRMIEEGATLHRSVVDRLATGYRPKNLPGSYQVIDSDGSDGPDA